MVRAPLPRVSVTFPASCRQQVMRKKLVSPSVQVSPWQIRGVMARRKVDRAFIRSGPNQLWVTDITEHPTREGKVYCAVVLDAYSRRVVGWLIDATPAALSPMRWPWPSRLERHWRGAIIHSDHGAQSASWAFTQRAKDSGLVPSMGSLGDCYDNAMIEAFWSRRQVELLDRHRWKTQAELANAIFDLPGDLPQPHQAPQQPEHTHPRYSSRTPPPWHEQSSHPTPRNQGQSRASGQPGAVQSAFCQHSFLATPCAAARRYDPSVPTSWDNGVWSVVLESCVGDPHSLHTAEARLGCLANQRVCAGRLGDLGCAVAIVQRIRRPFHLPARWAWSGAVS
jgi:hypothetical protein